MKRAVTRASWPTARPQASATIPSFAPPTRPQSLRAVSCAEILHAHMPWSRAVPYVLSGGAGQLMEKLVADDAQKKSASRLSGFCDSKRFPL